ncbi:DUF2339 domain-containing protein [Nocardia sp. NPDC052566]|uniref:DUF2339 domain-containing protein n=1 Tax=Nocardia sp. NPDC052566 TaxID=3364330 RepID=UPI0037C578FA
MTTSIDPALISRLSGEFTALGTQMGVLGRDLELLRAQVAAGSAAAQTVSTEPAPAHIPIPPVAAAPQPPAPVYVPQYAPPPGWPAGPQGGPVAPQRPALPRQMPMGAPAPGMRPPVRREPRTPWWQREGVISRILAVAGVTVTLIGVVMLLVLAAQAGLFGPIPRVVAGVLFSAVLVGAGMRVFGRTGGRVGGIALAGTGIAGAYLDVVAVTTIYGWLPEVFGLAVALAVAAGGVWLAMRWQSQPLAVLVVLGAALLSPVVTSQLVLLSFLIVLQLAFLPVQWQRDWPYLHVTRTVPAVLAAFCFFAIAGSGHPERSQLYWLLAAAIAIAAIGLSGTLAVVRKRAGDVTATVAFGLSALPLLAVPALFERRTAVIVALAFAAVLLTVAAGAVLPKLRALVRIPNHTAVVAAVAGAFALLEACFTVTDVQTAPIALFLVAVAFLGVAGQLRSKVAAGIGGAYALLGGFVFMAGTTPDVLASQHRSMQELDISTVLAAVLALAALAAGVWCIRKQSSTFGNTEESLLWIAATAFGLYAVTATTVSIGVATGSPDGFLIGHSAATILWMITATAALLFGLRMLARSAAAARIALASGLLITAAALAKLFLFDLATLDGLVRVAAFLVVGVLLLLAGTRYARAFAEANTKPTV